MSHYLYLTRTVHMPVTADGTLIKNSFGVTIAQAETTASAAALADIINLGFPAAKAQDAAYDASETRKQAMFAKSRKGAQ